MLPRSFSHIFNGVIALFFCVAEQQKNNFDFCYTEIFFSFLDNSEILLKKFHLFSYNVFQFPSATFVFFLINISFELHHSDNHFSA